ncbi:MAG: hypothetical protein KDB53_19415, partial [Planctomycetes bacterium]|nr:hypothetical protein [Planctomycetota bacterium]
MARSLGDGEDRARGQGIRSSGASFRRHPTLQALRRAGLVESDALIDAVQRWGSGPGGSEDEARSTIADLVREGPVSSYWHAVLHGLRSELVAAQDLQLAAGTGDGLGLGLAWTTPTGDTRPWWRPGPRRAACLRDLEGAILHAHLGRDLAQAARKALVEMSAEGYAEF